MLMPKSTELARLNEKVHANVVIKYYEMILTTSYYEIIPKHFGILKLLSILENALEKKQNDFFTLQDIQSKTQKLFQQTGQDKIIVINK